MGLEDWRISWSDREANWDSRTHSYPHMIRFVMIFLRDEIVKNFDYIAGRIAALEGRSVEVVKKRLRGYLSAERANPWKTYAIVRLFENTPHFRKLCGFPGFLRFYIEYFHRENKVRNSFLGDHFSLQTFKKKFRGSGDYSPPQTLNLSDDEAYIHRPISIDGKPLAQSRDDFFSIDEFFQKYCAAGC